jgi:hypothetical protein
MLPAPALDELKPNSEASDGHSDGWHRPLACAERRPAARNGESVRTVLRGGCRDQRPSRSIRPMAVRHRRVACATQANFGIRSETVGGGIGQW